MEKCHRFLFKTYFLPPTHLMILGLGSSSSSWSLIGPNVRLWHEGQVHQCFSVGLLFHMNSGLLAIEWLLRFVIFSVSGKGSADFILFLPLQSLYPKKSLLNRLLASRNVFHFGHVIKKKEKKHLTRWMLPTQSQICCRRHRLDEGQYGEKLHLY